MNNEQLATLAQLIIDSGLSDETAAGQYETVAAALNAATTIDNPEAQGQVARPLTLAEVFIAAKQTEDDRAAIKALPEWFVDMLKAELAQNDRTALATLLAFIQPDLSEGSQAALAALLAATIDDPTWTATISGPSLAADAGLPVVQPSDVQAVDVL